MQSITTDKLIMPHISARQQLLETLHSRQLDLQLAHYLELVKVAVEGLYDSDDSTSSSSSSDQDDLSMSSMSLSSMSSLGNSIFSGWSSSESEVTELLTMLCAFVEFSNTIEALHNEVEKTCVLLARPKTNHALQLHLLEEWALDHPEKFRHKLCVDPPVFMELVNQINNHPVFYNNSNNPQLPVLVQLAIFLNSAGHYGNAATFV